ncbi:MAG: hypothetical protein J6U54_10180 [Clostridiales bacterium]|nr:hypothetical protein [Clostridiales bacterium]
MIDTSYEGIEQFRKDLPILRAFAGWSSDALADMLGVSRATMIHIERGDAINTVYYLAIKKLLDEAADKDRTLKDVLDLLDVMQYHDMFITSATEIIKTRCRGRTKARGKEELGEWFRCVWTN